MPKEEWGVKRTCPSCEVRFYDLQSEPIVCPACGTTYDVDSHGKVSATRERKVVPARVVDEDLVDDEEVADDEEEAEEEALLGDDEDDAEPATPALSDEEDETEEVPFKDPSLIDEDEDDDDEDEDIDLDDDDAEDDIDLDDIAADEKP